MVWEEALLKYDFGPYHPMSPVRLELTHLLADSFGLLERPGVRVISAPVASDAELGAVHSKEFIAAVRAASAAPDAPGDPYLPFGIGQDDVPAFPAIHEASARIAGGSIAAMEEILSGRSRRAVSFAGGMHHAREAQAAGFCVYNDAAIAIRRALAEGEERVLYVDLDVHHGDGVERALWNEPRAVTLSLHETGERLFPGTGFVQDTGGEGARGCAINVPLPPRTGTGGWLRAITATVPALARAIRPTLLVTQHGADTHRSDPLADLSITLEGQREAMLLMRALADEICGGRWLALGGGGYAVADVVPRSWTHLIAIATGEPIPAGAPVPDAYREQSIQALGRRGLLEESPRFPGMGDGEALEVRDWAEGFDPDDALDRAIQSARRAAFPEWGLDPYFD